MHGQGRKKRWEATAEEVEEGATTRNKDKDGEEIEYLKMIRGGR